VATGHRKRPLVLTADRGRGKSSSLAIAVADRLLTTNLTELRIIITAPHLDAVNVFFNQLSHSCPLGKLHQNRFEYLEHQVEFIPVDVLLKDKPSASLLLVDEAAAIPVHILSQLLNQYHRIVFSSTQHGYEGAGRGFATKFKTILKDKVPNYNTFHMHQPIRWSENDPLEQFVFDAFLLNSSNELIENQVSIEKNSLVIRLITPKELVSNEKLLRQVFSVLITAHYQTTPSDLKLLLNNSALRLFVSSINNEIIGVVMAILEGKTNDDTADYFESIKPNERRLKNQFIPQSLFLHHHCRTAFNYRYLRIMRIAVVEQAQHQEVGSRLLQYMKDYATIENIDILGTSFGANQSLMSFWGKAGYQATRIGFSLDKASGEHSTLMLQSLTDEAKLIVSEVQQQFYQQFVFLLNEQYKMLCSMVVEQIIIQWPEKLLPKFSAADKQIVQSFIDKKCVYDSCVYSLHLWLIHTIYLQKHKALNVLEIGVLVFRILQKNTIESTCKQFNLTGKKQLNLRIIELVKQLN